MSSLSNTWLAVRLFACLIVMLSKLQCTSALDCFIDNCSSASCLVGFSRYFVTCKEDEVCMKFVSGYPLPPPPPPQTSVDNKPSRFSRTSSTRFVRLEKGCRPRHLIASQLTQKKIIEDKHFCEDLSISGSFGVTHPGIRCWCWGSDRCNKGSSLSSPLSFLGCIFKGIVALLASQYLRIPVFP